MNRFTITNIPNSMAGRLAAAKVRNVNMSYWRFRMRGRGARKNASEWQDLPMENASRFTLYGNRVEHSKYTDWRGITKVYEHMPHGDYMRFDFVGFEADGRMRVRTLNGEK